MPVRSFLDNIDIKESCQLICHDANHNGDIDGEKGCGNPSCWKHDVANSTAPKPERQYFCRCPWGTFPGEK